MRPKRADLATARLIVRSTQRSDAVDVAASMDDHVLREHGWSQAIKQAWVDTVAAGELQRSLLAVCDKETGRLVGTISVQPSPAGFHIGNVGVMLGPEGRGRGYAAEALTVALPYFHSLGLPRLVIETAEDNVAMRRSAEAAGATLTESYVHELPDGRRVSAVRYEHSAGRA